MSDETADKIAAALASARVTWEFAERCEDTWIIPGYIRSLTELLYRAICALEGALEAGRSVSALRTALEGCHNALRVAWFERYESHMP